MMDKSPLVAFFLSFIPGAGHLYLRRPIRALLYGGGFFGAIALALFILVVSGGSSEEVGIILLFIAAVFGFINMLDMIITLVSGKVFTPQATHGYMPHGEYPGSNASHAGPPPPYGPAGFQSAAYNQQGAAPGPGYAPRPDYELEQMKSKTILMSIIPGLGHMNLGLMQRGITFLVSFVGLFAITLFLSFITNSGSLLVFLLALPVIWIYSMFDASSLVQQKMRGELLEDKSLFEGIEAHIASGQKNRVLTIALAIFPGAGHLYLGLQKRGLQLMGGFLLAIYIMDNLRLSLFLFLLPLFWFFAFFDALTQLSRYGRQQMNDEPLLPAFVPYQRWLGIGLLGFGVYFLIDRILLGVVFRNWPGLYHQYVQYKYMLPTAIIAFVMIVIGLRLAFGRRSLLGNSTPSASVPPPRFEDKGGDGR
ncbi:hypothetical protein D3P07_18215 [Paenibacillus sp. 1011MAR3C5]|uniref:hypothetical protein n=1 Tax=Paenibacillus sp. 1011MAR3C5 TaxID=1675787 RepID=UPI000E6CC337|nr:hypothetical protein [Paenibacillus sp. 1011MAR3C5]RJE86025.1 hypothetical protein D3P07_18215 [Paenibacillus sp. 1011MAR3C5]